MLLVSHSLPYKARIFAARRPGSVCGDLATAMQTPKSCHKALAYSLRSDDFGTAWGGKTGMPRPFGGRQKRRSGLVCEIYPSGSPLMVRLKCLRSTRLSIEVRNAA